MGGVEQGRGAAALLELIGHRAWQARLAELRAMARDSPRVARALAQRHAIEVALDRLRRGQPAGPAAASVDALAGRAAAAMRGLPAEGRRRMARAIAAGLSGEGTLSPLFHLLRAAALHEARGFEVSFAGFADGAPFDLLIHRDGSEAEIVCEVVSAEEGRDVHRAAWLRLVDAVDPDLQTWLAQHPGRYLLKMTLPQGLRAEEESQGELHRRIRALLTGDRRADQDGAAVLRLDPLLLAAAQADEAGLLASLRRAFGHEAHLAVMTAGNAVCVLAARAGREDDVADAVRRRMAAIAPGRLTGTRPGILAMFVDDTDAHEWRQLREHLAIEGAARQFLTEPPARHVVAVTCASRRELFEAADPAEAGDLRFRNPGHPAARLAALAEAVVSIT
jgi:hypothetical protein